MIEDENIQTRYALWLSQVKLFADQNNESVEFVVKAINLIYYSPNDSNIQLKDISSWLECKQFIQNFLEIER